MMACRHLFHAALLAALALPACTSRDEKAARAAAFAAADLQSGQLAAARFQIGQALAARDDVSDYWLLSAQISMAEGNYGSAFEGYENVLTLDRSNAEALTRICQIALSADVPVRAERYAEQLQLLHPGDKLALTVKAAAALKRGDKKGAAAMLDKVLAAAPDDALALIVKSKLLAADNDYAGAAKVAEASLATPGDPGGRLDILKGLYLNLKDAAGYARTVARIARAYPDAPAPQLDYATNLYANGDRDSALAVTRRVLALRPDDVATANAVLNLWLAQGAAAMPAPAITAGAANASLEGKAAYAQYANEIGRPDLALAVLGDAAAAAPANAATADAKVARAYAKGLRGDLPAANAEIAAVLAVDDGQPRALLARARLRAKAGDRRGAIEDARRVVTGDKANATAGLTLADLLLAEDQAVLAESVLRDGLTDTGSDPRVAKRLAALLQKQGRAADAAAVLTDYARDNPFSRLGK